MWRVFAYSWRIRYHPLPDYEGPDQVTYEICDAGGGCDTATLYLTVVLWL